MAIVYRKQSIYEGLRRPRWSQFASEIYKIDPIVYGTCNVDTWISHLFVSFQLLQVTQVIHLKARYSRQAESIVRKKEMVWKQRIAHEL